jgi:hypothetical protein
MLSLEGTDEATDLDFTLAKAPGAFARPAW